MQCFKVNVIQKTVNVATVWANTKEEALKLAQQGTWSKIERRVLVERHCYFKFGGTATRGQAVPAPVLTYPVTIESSTGLLYAVELIQYGPNNYEVHVGELKNGHTFGSSGRLSLVKAYAKYNEQVKQAENGDRK